MSAGRAQLAVLPALVLGGLLGVACGDKGGSDGAGDGGADGGAVNDGGGTNDGGTADSGGDGGGADGGGSDGGAATTETDCSDGVDDDSDGLIDCADEDCARDAACAELVCNDGVDNDSDGLTDCEDEDCLGNPWCPELDCGDGIDNDGDGHADCTDADCLADPACLGEDDCTNGIDDDSDGLVDCADDDCTGKHGCYEEDCTDGRDDDADGFVDCLDGDCFGRTGCIEDICDDGIDNDGDGGIDCLDVDCWPSRACLADCAAGDAGPVGDGTVYSGDTTTATNDFRDVDTCGAAGGLDEAFIWEVPEPGCFALSTEGSAFDTVLRTYHDCRTADEETCNDDADSTVTTSLLYMDGAAGDVHLVVVDGYDSHAYGSYTVSASRYASPWETDIGDVSGDDATTGNIDGLEDLDWMPSCASSAEYDDLLLWTVPSTGTWSLDLSDADFDTVMAVVLVGDHELDDRCPEELACNDDEDYAAKIFTSALTVDLVEGQRVVIWIAGYDGSSVGYYPLDINPA